MKIEQCIYTVKENFQVLLYKIDRRKTWYIHTAQDLA